MTSATVAALSLAALPVTAHAQEAAGAASPEGGIEVVIVTAQKRSQNVQDIPIAVSVATSADIERLQVDNLSDLQFATPSLVVAGSDPTRQRFGIRGVSDQSRNAGVDNRIGVYVDGVWVGRSAASNQDAYDVSSLEILRGPQGTLFGKNTVAGAINITTARPQPGQTGGSVTLEAGDYDLRRARGQVNLGIGENAAFRLSGGTAQREGFTRNLFNGATYDNRDDQSLRAQFLYEGDRLSVYLTADSTRQESRALASGERAPDTQAPNPREIRINELQPFAIEYDGVSAQFDYDLPNGATLTSISAYRTSSYSGSSDEDFSPGNFARSHGLGEDTEHFSQELRYTSDDSGPLDYVVGVYYLTQDLASRGSAEAFAPAINPAFPPVFVGAQQSGFVDSESFAAFAHGNYQFSDALVLTVGARLNWEEKSIRFRITDTSTLFTNGTLNDSRSSTDFSPTASLTYTFSPNVMGYVRYARGFKSGGWNADYVRSVSAIRFDDESVDAYEVGLKSTLLDNRLRLNVAAYRSTHDDYQVFAFVQLPNGGTALNVTNAGKLSSQGFELEAELEMTDWLSVFANYGFNDASFDSFKNGGGPGVDFDGNRPAEAPRHNLNLGMEMNFELGFADLVVQGDYSYRSEFYSNPDNLPINLNSSLTQVNLRAGLEFPTFTVFAWARNVTDETTQIYNGRSFLGFPRVKYNDPRTVGITVQMWFGN